MWLSCPDDLFVEKSDDNARFHEGIAMGCRWSSQKNILAWDPFDH